MTAQFKGRHAIITGGGKGIGAAIAQAFADQGAKVSILGRDAKSLEAHAQGLGAFAYQCDVTHSGSIAQAFAACFARHGDPYILVNNAGQAEAAGFADTSRETWDRMLAVNLTGTFHCCQVAVPDMLDAAWGRIVMISSSSAQRGSPKMAHYAASKGALLSDQGAAPAANATIPITVNNVPPSGIDTPMQHQGQAAGHLPPNEQMAAAIPVGHLGTGDDIAAAVGFLCSEQAGFITGQVLGVNGGQVL